VQIAARDWKKRGEAEHGETDIGWSSASALHGRHFL
jgi:hypothetical protein